MRCPRTNHRSPTFVTSRLSKMLASDEGLIGVAHNDFLSTRFLRVNQNRHSRPRYRESWQWHRQCTSNPTGFSSFSVIDLSGCDTDERCSLYAPANSFLSNDIRSKRTFHRLKTHESTSVYTMIFFSCSHNWQLTVYVIKDRLNPPNHPNLLIHPIAPNHPNLLIHPIAPNHPNLKVSSPDYFNEKKNLNLLVNDHHCLSLLEYSREQTILRNKLLRREPIFSFQFRH